MTKKEQDRLSAQVELMTLSAAADADIEAGRVGKAEPFFAELRARYGLKKD